MPDQLPIPKDFLSILACPACDDRPSLEIAEDNAGLLCKSCGRIYPVTETGIPQLTVESAKMPKSGADSTD